MRHRAPGSQGWQSKPDEWWKVLPEGQQAIVRARSERVTYLRQSSITLGDLPETVYFLESGLVRLYRRSAHGDEITLGFVRAGDVFGHLPYLTGSTRNESAVTLCASMVWRTPYDVVSTLVTEHPDLLVVVARQLAARLRRIEDRLTDLAFRRVPTRLAATLLDLAHDFGRLENGVVILELTISQDDMASLVGATRQTVNVELSALAAAGLLRVDRRRLVLLDIDVLRALSESE